MAQLDALVPGGEFWELDMINVNVAVVMAPLIDCAKHSTATNAPKGFFAPVNTSIHCKHMGTSLAYEVHTNILITEDLAKQRK